MHRGVRAKLWVVKRATGCLSVWDGQRVIPVHVHGDVEGVAMMIEQRAAKPSTKELKVAIPVRYHLQLHALKVLEGRQIHSIVQEALDGYFHKLKGDQAGE